MIRKATQSDVANLVGLLKKFHKERKFEWAFNPALLSITFSSAILSPENWICLTGEGCLLLATCFVSPLGAGKLAVEYYLCAEKPGQFELLLEAYETWARSKSCDLISLGCTERFPAFQRLYGRYGYQPAEMTMSKVL
jgi:hypothetical protein